MRILLVGGEANLSAELLEYVADLGDEWEVQSVPDGSAAIVAVSSATIDAIIVAPVLPDLARPPCSGRSARCARKPSVSH